MAFEKLHLSRGEFEKLKELPEYSATMPSGVVPGKRWRRHDGAFDPTCNDPIWLVCEYGPEVDGRCAIIIKRPCVRVPALTDRCVMFSRRAAIMESGRDFKLKLGEEFIERCMSLIGYEPKLIYRSEEPKLHVLVFRTAKDAIAYRMIESEYLREPLGI